MKTQTAVDFIENEIVEMQDRYILLAKKDKKHSKGVDAILTATTLLKMKLKQAKQMERDHTTTQIEALRERLLNKCKIEDILKKGCGHVLLRSEIDQTINEFLKEINDERI
jgi:hypothetical protein